ncbi:MAG: hypothetical protein CMJ78_08130 [Planctomycetaceae bacterium]|nr:hypothetical protein [Planctomycetaceae bacterium]
MDGHLDSTNAAWITIELSNGPLDFLIDTGFQGTLIIGEDVFDSGNAEWAGETHADLAAGQSWTYTEYFIEIERFGEPVKVQALVGPGSECLVGTDILAPHNLDIDYRTGKVQLIKSVDW